MTRKLRARPLTPKQQRFVDEYLVDLNATQAAIRAGYSRKTAHSCGPRMLENADVARAVAEAQAARAERVGITADEVVARIEETVRRCSQTEPVRDARGKVIPGLYTFDARSVLRGCELLGKHLGIFRDRPEPMRQITITREIVHVTRPEGVLSPDDLADY
jgi:phage terminase small subunit